MARKPNYDFERREREKAKAAKAAERAKAKAGHAEPTNEPGQHDPDTKEPRPAGDPSS